MNRPFENPGGLAGLRHWVQEENEPQLQKIPDFFETLRKTTHKAGLPDDTPEPQWAVARKCFILPDHLEHDGLVPRLVPLPRQDRERIWWIWSIRSEDPDTMRRIEQELRDRLATLHRLGIPTFLREQQQCTFIELDDLI